jgi:hypothetical protein
MKIHYGNCFNNICGWGNITCRINKVTCKTCLKEMIGILKVRPANKFQRYTRDKAMVQIASLYGRTTDYNLIFKQYALRKK